MDDLISRIAVHDRVDRIVNVNHLDPGKVWFTPIGVKALIEQMPSAQPEPTTEIQEILNYLDTTLHPIVSPDNWNVYAELHDMISKLPPAQPEIAKRAEKSAQNVPNDNLISRKAAIEAAALSAAEWDGMYVQDINGRIREALENLPSAQPHTAEEIQKMQENEAVQLEKAYELGRESAQPEESIPVSWIESRIERFMMSGDAFSGLTASIIRVMLNEWKREQEGDTK